MLTPDDIARGLALAEEASPSPWKIGESARLRMCLMEQDADFIVAARTGWPAALREVLRLRAALEEIGGVAESGVCNFIRNVLSGEWQPKEADNAR